MMFPACPLGTISAESVRIIGVMAPEGRGVLVRGMDIFLDSAVPLGPTDYWIIELGTLQGEDFVARALSARPQQGLAKGRNAVDLNPKVRYDTGEVVAVRARPIGGPSALTGCDVVLRVQEP